jgi:hypothetical protein
MSQQGETKTCKLCGMGIPATARKCPYCHHWQRWLSLQNPPVMTLLIMLPAFALYGIMIDTVFNPFRQWEQFSKHADQVRIVDSKVEFGEDSCGPAVIVVGKVENLSLVDWKDVHFQVEFFNPKGQFFDTGQQEIYTWRVPAGQQTSFKISFRRQLPEKEYASHKVRMISAVDSRNRF